MAYHVIWTESALSDLALIWMDAENRNTVSEASEAIDQLLAENPRHARLEVVLNQGTMMRGPIGVDFWISDEQNKVTVFAAWKAIRDWE